MANNSALVIATFFITVFGLGASMKCYQCDSTLDNNCQEMWDHSLKINQEKYQECNLWDPNYCVKVTGMWGGRVGTHRFCSTKNMGDQCQDIWFPDHDRMYRACVYTCTGDGCNGASAWSTFPVVLVGVLSGVFALWRSL